MFLHLLLNFQVALMITIVLKIFPFAEKAYAVSIAHTVSFFLVNELSTIIRMLVYVFDNRACIFI